ncbi:MULTISPECIES: hypothetical protein [Cycloclasticus]|uniref:DUF1302 domain-containing protein n=1 Tax=Cycloclasticus pugetii TaxID=34068 RepID=A0AB33Z1H1_9GAMM|nr:MULTISPECIES: hypothetical protein [Cycloclasticus]ATI02197.1 hypothetical protein CPC19_01610 [Cycloclasticus sp. PY97N]EPD13047.1 hypothetical protein L196_05380 [Cycloclasticus pugetii]
MKKITKISLAAILGVSMVAPAMAIDTGIKGLTQSGRIKLGASVLYDLPDQGNKAGPANWIIESKTTYRPNRQWSFIGNFWLRGDMSSQFTSYDSPNGGLPDQVNGAIVPGTGAFTQNANFNLNSSNCSGNAYCAEMDDELEVLKDWEDVIRELSVKYRDKKNRFSIKAGRFQRGWGQSDGLRLMDVLHAQDLRQRFAFTDSDELRLPALMVSADFNFRKLGIEGPFKAIGMKNPSLEINFVPEVQTSNFIINNPTPGDQTSGGIFGLDWADVNDTTENGPGLVGLGFNLYDNKPNRLSLTDAEWSMRLKFGALGGSATINAFYGQQDLPVSKLLGSTLIIGDGTNNPNAAGAITLPTFDAATTEAIVHGQGGYLDWLRSADNFAKTGAAPLGSPLTLLAGCDDPLTPVVEGPACSINGEVELDYDYRQLMVGFTFARDLSDFIRIGRKSSAPTVRLEMSHEFDHPFNRSRVSPGATFGPFDGSLAGEVTGSGVLAVEASRNIVKEDITSTMIGFDFPLWVPGWESQAKSIFTSLQLFDIYTHNSDQGLLQQSPYAFTEIQDHQNFVTFAWNAPLDNQRLVLDGLYIRDFQGSGDYYRQRIDFNYFGDSWRPRVEIAHFSGNKESAPIGTFNNSDYVEVSLTYQF